MKTIKVFEEVMITKELLLKALDEVSVEWSREQAAFNLLEKVFSALPGKDSYEDS